MKDSENSLAFSPPDDLRLTAEGDGKKSVATKVGAAVLALILTIGLLAGYFYLRGRNDRALAARQAAEKVRASAPPEAQVFQDEVRLAGGQALVGGTVRNISPGRLENLSVEIELRSRMGDEREIRQAGVEPRSLGPGEGGKFSLQIAPKAWGGASVVRLRSAARESDVPFKPELGERRPPEPRPSPKVVVVPRPKSKDGGFINTPDTPIRIP